MWRAASQDVQEHCGGDYRWPEGRRHQRAGDSQPVDGRRIRHTLHRGPGEALPGLRADGRWRRPDDLGQHLDERSRRILGRRPCNLVLHRQHWPRRLQ